MTNEGHRGGRRAGPGDVPPAAADADADAWVAQWAAEEVDTTELGYVAEVAESVADAETAELGDIAEVAESVADAETAELGDVAEVAESVAEAETGPVDAGIDAASGDDESDGDGLSRRAGSSDDAATIEAWRRAQERSRRQAQIRANQRAARQMQRLLPGGGAADLPLTGFSIASGGGQAAAVRRLSLMAGFLLVVVVGLVGYVFIGLGTEPPADEAPVPPLASELGLTVGADVAPATIDELILSTVQLVGLDDDLVPQCAGSGVIVTSDGTILTNAHVVTSGRVGDLDSCNFTTIGVGVTVDTATPPELLYEAEVVELSLGVDLAVLRIAGPLTDDGGAAWPRSFEAAPLGDSDTVELGDSVRIFGYPVIGGDTITLTTGTVSGFTSQVGLGNRALIKTDATISAGNSGGLAVDDAGRVIGIPTKAQASELGPIVDCRPVDDTNGDGLVGGGDDCVSVGGFLNGIRPINLSLDLLALAGVSEPLRPEDPVDRPEIDLDRLRLFNPRFAVEVRADGTPGPKVVTATAGVERLCLFVDWAGIPEGAGWDGAWYVDNEIQSEDNTYIGRTWTDDAEGQGFGMCHEAEDGAGLPVGIHEIAFYLNGKLVFVEGIELTAAPVEQVSIDWINATGVDLCGLAINPKAISNQLGLNVLPPDTVIPAGGEWSTMLPLGTVVAEAYDCNGEPLANELKGLPITEPGELEISLI